MKIKVFQHILLENHWYSIVKEHYRLIKETNMLGDITDFYITLSCVDKTKSKEVENFYNRFVDYLYEDCFFYGKKLHIIEHKKEEFEYPTLEKAIEISKEDKDFVGFYFHTKGAARLTTDNEMMRESMDKGCFDFWKEHIDAIENKCYDMSGSNFLLKNDHDKEGKYYKKFYSGNFFFFNPNFLQKVDFSKIDKSIRWWAESIYGYHYDPKCNNVGYVSDVIPFIKTGNIL